MKTFISIIISALLFSTTAFAVPAPIQKKVVTTVKATPTPTKVTPTPVVFKSYSMIAPVKIVIIPTPTPAPVMYVSQMVKNPKTGKMEMVIILKK